MVDVELSWYKKMEFENFLQVNLIFLNTEFKLN